MDVCVLPESGRSTRLKLVLLAAIRSCDAKHSTVASHCFRVSHCCFPLRSRAGREASSRKANRSERRECQGTSGIARRRPRHCAANYRHARRNRPLSPRRRSARHSRHQPEKARRDAALRHRFRAASAAPPAQKSSPPAKKTPTHSSAGNLAGDFVSSRMLETTVRCLRYIEQFTKSAPCKTCP